jgi:hypothetical protein
MIAKDWDDKQAFSGASLRYHADLVSNIQRDVKSLRALFREFQKFNITTNQHLSETHHLLLEIEGRCCTVAELLHEAARKSERLASADK